VSRAKILDLGTSAAAKPILDGELLGKATYSSQDKEDMLQKHDVENEEKRPFFRRIGEKT
jgi:hypothetical protein